MKVMKMRTAAKICLAVAFAVAVVALIFFERLMFWQMLALLGTALLFAVLSVVFTAVYWRCPKCGKKFGVYDVKVETEKKCPYCSEKFD
ncbi:MAG: hypothetical protein J5874_03240 [Oscillospiraceae bacterium]|nr:hypothetical protein [Oscillospiraceae bacterium]